MSCRPCGQAQAGCSPSTEDGEHRVVDLQSRARVAGRSRRHTSEREVHSSAAANGGTIASLRVAARLGLPIRLQSLAFSLSIVRPSFMILAYAGPDDQTALVLLGKRHWVRDRANAAVIPTGKPHLAAELWACLNHDAIDNPSLYEKYS